MNGIREDGTVACTACGTVHVEATDLLLQLRDDLGNVERDLRAKRSAIKRLQADQAAALRGNRHYEAAKRVLLRWQELCAPAARELEGKGRLDNVIARMNAGHDEEMLVQCIEGYAKFPYVVDGKRSSKGTPKDWHADAELIFRTPKNVANGIRYARQQEVELPNAIMAQLPWQRVKELNRKLIEDKLTALFGKPLITGSLVTVKEWPCPRCVAKDPEAVHTTSFRMGNTEQRLGECWKCGLTDEVLVTRIANG
jgi:hypothetical protein